MGPQPTRPKIWSAVGVVSSRCGRNQEGATLSAVSRRPPPVPLERTLSRANNLNLSVSFVYEAQITTCINSEMAKQNHVGTTFFTSV